MSNLPAGGQPTTRSEPLIVLFKGCKGLCSRNGSAFEAGNAKTLLVCGREGKQTLTGEKICKPWKTMLPLDLVLAKCAMF